MPSDKSADDSIEIIDPVVPQPSGRGHRMKKTSRLVESLEIHHQDDDGQPVQHTKQPTRRKHAKRDGRSKNQPNSDPEDGDFSGSEVEDESEDSEADGNISNSELAGALVSKIIPKTSRHNAPSKRRLSEDPAPSTSKKNRVTIEDVDDDSTHDVQAEPEVTKKLGKGKLGNPIYHFYTRSETPWNDEPATPGSVYYKCRHGETCDPKTITKKMNYNLNGLIGHLRTHHPPMYRLFEILKTRATPLTPQEESIASAQTKLGAADLSKFLARLDGGTPSIAAAMDKYLEKAKGPFSQEHFVSLLLKCIIALDLPFDTVSKSEFQDLLQYTHHHSPKPLTIPGRTTVKTNIIKMEGDVVQATREMFKKLDGKVAISLDAWTSSNHYAFLAIVAHFVNNDGVLEERLIDFREMEGAHSGINMAEAVWDTLTAYGLLNKVIAFVMDNASNNDTMMTALEDRFREKSIPFSARHARLRCMPHTIHLAALKLMDGIGAITSSEASSAASRTGMYQAATIGDDDNEGCEPSDDEGEDDLVNPDGRDIASSVTRLRKIIRAIRSSPQRRQSWLKDLASSLQATPIGDPTHPVSRALMLILDVRTRWTSTYQMIDRALQYRECFNVFVFKHDELQGLGIKPEEWTILQSIRDWLFLFKKATTEMSATKYPMISFVHAVFRGLQESLRDTLANLPPSMPTNIRLALISSHEKLAEYYFKFDQSPFYAWAALLDPRISLTGLELDFEHDPILSAELPQMKKDLKTHLATFYKDKKKTRNGTEITNGAVNHRPTEAPSAGASMVSRYHNLPRQARDEVEEFWKLPLEDFDTCDPIEWWYGRQSQFPHLHHMALDILSIPGSAVAVERVFSGGRDTISLRRASLKPDTIRALMLLKYHIRGARKLSS